MLGGLINEYRNCSLNPQVNAHSRVLEPRRVERRVSAAACLRLVMAERLVYSTASAVVNRTSSARLGLLVVSARDSVCLVG